jgi:hypothetical protein
MALPWIEVPFNKTQRARVNSAYGAPLKKIYPAGVFFASNTTGAPGQPNTPRVLPAAGNPQATDPRASGGFFGLIGNSGVNSLVGGGTVNVGGNAYTTQTGNSQLLLLGLVGIIIYAVFK